MSTTVEAAWWSKVQWRTHFERLWRSGFVRSTAIVMSGTAVAQIIAFALSPVISRLFSPTEFGIAGSFASVVNVLSTVVTLQYSQAIILPKTNKEAINLLAVSWFTTLLLSLLCFAACIVAPATINGLMRTTGMLIPV